MSVATSPCRAVLKHLHISQAYTGKGRCVRAAQALEDAFKGVRCPTCLTLLWEERAAAQEGSGHAVAAAVASRRAAYYRPCTSETTRKAHRLLLDCAPRCSPRPLRDGEPEWIHRLWVRGMRRIRQRRAAPAEQDEQNVSACSCGCSRPLRDGEPEWVHRLWVRGVRRLDQRRADPSRDIALHAGTAASHFRRGMAMIRVIGGVEPKELRTRYELKGGALTRIVGGEPEKSRALYELKVSDLAPAELRRRAPALALREMTAARELYLRLECHYAVAATALMVEVIAETEAEAEVEVSPDASAERLLEGLTVRVEKSRGHCGRWYRWIPKELYVPIKDLYAAVRKGERARIVSVAKAVALVSARLPSGIVALRRQAMHRRLMMTSPWVHAVALERGQSDFLKQLYGFYHPGGNYLALRGGAAAYLYALRNDVRPSSCSGALAFGAAAACCTDGPRVARRLLARARAIAAGCSSCSCHAELALWGARLEAPQVDAPALTTGSQVPGVEATPALTAGPRPHASGPRPQAPERDSVRTQTKGRVNMPAPRIYPPQDKGETDAEYKARRKRLKAERKRLREDRAQQATLARQRTQLTLSADQLGTESWNQILEASERSGKTPQQVVVLALKDANYFRGLIPQVEAEARQHRETLETLNELARLQGDASAESVRRQLGDRGSARA